MKDGPGRTWADRFFRSLDHRNFRLLWIGQALQSEGQWMEQVARGWLLWELSHDPFTLGLYGALRSLPAIVMALPAGLLADRLSRVRLLQSAQVAACILAFSFGILVQAGLMTVWLVMAFAVANGTAEIMRRPASQALISNLVPAHDMLNAVALNEVAQYTMRILGPVLAVVLLGVIQGVVGQPYQYLMPVFADEIFHVDALGLGLLTAAAGVGALAGALVLATLRTMGRVGLVLLGALLAYGGCMIAFSFAPGFAIALFLLLGVGASQSMFLAMRQTLVQLLVRDDVRGRVFSVTHLTRGTLSPAGAYASGILANGFGAQAAVGALGASIILVGLGCISLLPTVRRLNYADVMDETSWRE